MQFSTKNVRRFGIASAGSELLPKQRVIEGGLLGGADARQRHRPAAASPWLLEPARSRSMLGTSGHFLRCAGQERYPLLCGRRCFGGVPVGYLLVSMDLLPVQ